MIVDSPMTLYCALLKGRESYKYNILSRYLSPVFMHLQCSQARVGFANCTQSKEVANHDITRKN